MKKKQLKIHKKIIYYFTLFTHSKSSYEKIYLVNLKRSSYVNKSVK